jgi:flavin reductase (DIM6/NTAB) family NADH-FMN oxidoreductase RutF
MSDPGSAVGRIPSGVAILTATHDGQSTGMLTSWIQQACIDPLMVTVAVKRGRPIESLIDGSSRFVLNVLGESPTAMFRHFGKGFAPDEPAFDGVDTRDWAGGVRLANAVAWIACEVETKANAGDHALYVGRVVEEDVASEGKPHVHVRKSGLSY